MSTFFSIGQLSKLTGCKITTIRWYEQQDLLPAASRSSGNQRRYSDRHLLVLRFVRHARALGFDLSAVRQLQQLNSERFDEHLEADRIARAHLSDVQNKIRQLQALEGELAEMIDGCRFDQNHQCRILEVLANHALCETDRVSGITTAATVWATAAVGLAVAFKMLLLPVLLAAFLLFGLLALHYLPLLQRGKHLGIHTVGT